MNHGNVKPRAARAGAGFTLIELLAAMVIISFGLVAILQLPLVAIRGSGYAQEIEGANHILRGVMNELRVKALGWTNDVNFAAAFPNIALVDTKPAVGETLKMDTDLHALRTYAGQPIANSDAPQDALPINIFGISEGASGLTGASAIYRVHYVGYPEIGAIADPLVVRLTLFVSWDNKDHGEQATSWDDFWNSGGKGFWKRHMVTATLFLDKHR